QPLLARSPAARRRAGTRLRPRPRQRAAARARPGRRRRRLRRDRGSVPPQTGMSPAPLVSVVIPAFNEEDLVAHCVTETVATLTELGFRHEVIVVDDGSADGTAELAQTVADSYPNVRVIGHEVNLGKGSALIRGGLAALGDLVLFVDADLEVHPRQLELPRQEMDRTGADVVIGSKLHPDSQIEYPRQRRVLSRGYYIL